MAQSYEWSFSANSPADGPIVRVLRYVIGVGLDVPGHATPTINTTPAVGGGYGYGGVVTAGQFDVFLKR